MTRVAGSRFRPRLLRFSVLSTSVVAAAIGELSHAVTYEPCRSVPTSSDGRPDPGTPAAAYCNAVWHGYDWVAFALLGAAIGVLAYLSLRPVSRSWRFVWSIGLVAVLAIANAAIADSLRSYFGL